MIESVDPALWIVGSLLVSGPFIFIAMWCGVCKLLALIGGWARLARRYPAGRRRAHDASWMQAGGVGVVRYNGTLTLGTCPEGLHLSVMKLFSFGHPPVFIPWPELHGLKAHDQWGIERLEFQAGHPAVTKLFLPKNVLLSLPHIPAAITSQL